MPTSAVLDDLIDALEMQSDSLFVFLDRETGEVEEISEELLSLARLSRRRSICFRIGKKRQPSLRSVFKARTGIWNFPIDST